MTKTEKKSSFMLISLLAAMIVAVAACSGGGGDDDDDDDDDGSGVPAGEVELSIIAVPHANEVAVFRMKQQGGGAPPIVCSTATLDAAGVGTVSTGGLVAMETYDRVQLVLNLDGNDTLDIGVDHMFRQDSPITAGATTGVSLSFNHSDYAAGGWITGAGGPTDPPPQWDWTDGLSCPGE